MNNKDKLYDIIVLGGGHAGSEAAYCASQFKELKVALISMPDVPLGSAPCNPAIGGVGKGQVVREIDALGGLMGKAADRAGIHFKVLNESKGPAVQSTRVQIDKLLYSAFITKELEKIENLSIFYEKIQKISEDSNYFECIGHSGVTIRGSKVIVTAGTFLGGKLHEGSKVSLGGRVGASQSEGIDTLFAKVQKLTKRFKTGTPPRIKKSTIDFSKTKPQPSEDFCRNFHYLHDYRKRFQSQVSCYLTYTNDKTIDLITRI